VHGKLVKADATALTTQVLEFLTTRLRGVLLEKCPGADDIVDGAMAAGSAHLPELLARVQALDALRTHNEADFANLLRTFKRVANIVAQAHEKGFLVPDIVVTPMLTLAAERVLADRVALYGAQDAGAAHLKARVQELADLRPIVDAFFDACMVMVDDEPVRAARLSLMHGINKLLLRLADFTRVQA
jgi:glycyl-tRNA synthetase beta chain